jgi:PAS domain S-box-containing protein
MAAKDEEDDRLHSVVLQNAQSILVARRRAEEALHNQSEWLRITLASIGDAVISTDAKGRVTFLNGVAEALTGWTQAEAAGRPLPEVLHLVNEQTGEPAENPALRALREGITVALAKHTVLTAKDGTARPIDDSAAPIRDDAGVLVGAVLVFRDVSEHRKAQEAQARLAAIVESSEDAIVSKSLDGVIRSWNAGAERLFGYAAHEAVGQPITFIIPDDRRHEEAEILARIARGERVEHFETIRVSKQGRLIDISVTVSPIRDGTGRIIGASKIARDITDRKRAEAAQARVAAIVESSQDAMYSKSLDGVILSWNTGAARIFGYAPHEAIGQPNNLIIPPDRQDEEQEIIARILQGDDVEHFETVRVSRQGRLIDVSLTVSPIRDAAGRVIGVSKVARDITDRKRTEEALREADRRKDQFIALLAHELRNPLAPLRNGLQILRLAADDASAVAETRAMMERQLGHMVRLIEDLLDISRIGQNKMDLRRARVLLAEVVSSAVETARPAIDAAGNRLTVSLPPDPVYLHADLTRLSQVFSNLLTNSAKYTECGGRIWLTAEQQDGVVVVSVRDTGIGIPADALPRIFDMFSQVDRSIERSSGGLGIGLALVKGLVEMHGGTVEAASEGPGKGSIFTVRLPAMESPQKPQAEDASNVARAAAPRRRVLVVDDNRDSAVSMAMMLRLTGNEVSTAHDGIEAVDAAERIRPQVILMDVGMPRLNGYDATRRIREQPWGGDIVIIALTGWGQKDDRLRSRKAGCDGHLVKPVDLADLEQLLNDLTGAHRIQV